MNKGLDKHISLAVLIGFVIGVIWLVALRFMTYQSDTVHYHANFALYINDQRDLFDNFTFYEEVQSCGADEKNNPKNRVHLHDQVNHVVHVHEPGVTWAHFFANLGYALGDSLVKTDDGVFIDGQTDSQLTFILNGEEVSTIANEHIKDEDKLLINFGKTDTSTLMQRYENIPKDAAEYNRRNDPSSCSGAETLTFWQRLKKSIEF